jgi:hypothetical protein
MATSERSGRRTEESARYRRAAEDTLDQLDWCIDYLHRIGKSRIAEALERNLSLIRRQMSRTGG